MPAERIRPQVLGVARRGAELLVAELFEPDGAAFYRPPGGGIEFWESSEEAVVREFREELDVEVEPVDYLGTVENRFTWGGQRQQELAVVHEVAFADGSLYDRDVLHGVDGGGDVTFETEWATLDALRARAAPLYPERLDEVLAGDAVHVVC